MLQNDENLWLGAPRGAALRKTVQLITGKLLQLGRFSGDRLLDVGCGDGTFTQILATGFREIHGIDVQEPYLEKFREAVKNDHRYMIANMSASAMTFPDDHFETIVTIETLEHVPDLTGAGREICRVLRPGGELLITVPNRWFPFETHGIRIGSEERHGRIPFLTYLPPLHRRFALARVFKVSDLDSLFVAGGLKRVAVDYAWPTFEHGGNRLQPLFRPLFGLMRVMERSPVRLFGTSVIVRYVKE